MYGGVMFKRYILIMLWCIFIAFSVIHLLNSLFNTDNPTLKVEAYLLYVLLLSLFSFPLGTVGNIILLLCFELIPINFSIDTENIIFSIAITVSSSFSFYYQWYIIYPKVKQKVIHWRK